MTRISQIRLLEIEVALAPFDEMTAQQQHWAMLATEIDHQYDRDQLCADSPRSMEDIAREVITSRCGPKTAEEFIAGTESRAYLGLPALS